MRKILVLVIAFSSLTLHAQKDCSHHFLKLDGINPAPVSRQEIRKSLDETLDLIAREMDSAPLHFKIEKLNEQYNIISSHHKQMMKEIPEGSFPDIEEKKLKEWVAERTDKLNQEALKMFRDEGHTVEVVEGHFKGQDYSYLEYIPTASQKGEAPQKLLRYKERFKTESVTIDFFSNILISSHGFSVAAARRIDLGKDGLKDILLDDMVKFVTKHEFTHAAFIRRRDQGIHSIYYSNYVGNKKAPLGSSGYQLFMSAEELYTGANNFFWASERLMNPKSFSAEEIINDLDIITSYFRTYPKLIEQTIGLSDEFSGVIKKLKSSLAKGELDEFPRLYDANHKVCDDPECTMYIMFIDPKGRQLFSYLGKESKDILTELHLRKIIGEKVDPITYKDKYMTLLDRALADQMMLNKTSSSLLEKFNEMAPEASKISEQIKSMSRFSPGFHHEPQQVERLSALAKKFRKLGNYVKEDSKDFLGK